ncbi:hypothetical protein [Actinomadura rupiterrae]|uniref:hypothetical protein n=1 Tax=Actinomadura rupiterrae TaxID=559627 RepID=UPI0020A4FB13|nr:hypothetical protein [Actinomadura rupiterrae]MCP2338461.1 hypothetical protein [Actinomadura rupiterrae]
MLLFSWLAGGLLVATLPFGLLGSLLSSDGGTDDTSAPGWEMLLIMIGFVGMGAGVAIALPIYLRERCRTR